MKKSTLCVAASLIGAALSQSVAAQTASTTFDVTITILNDCTIVSAGNLDFGSIGSLVANVDAQSDIVVNCTTGLDYDVALDEGAGGGTTSTRVMTSGGDTVGYQLYQEAARSSVWGAGPADLVSSVGTGDQQTFTVYGRVPPQTTPPAAAYTDTIGVQITF